MSKLNGTTDFTVAVEPSCKVFNNNALFDPASKWNRDDHLSPFHRLYTDLNERGVMVNTADLLFNGQCIAKKNYYYSFGILNDYKKWKLRDDIVLKDFVLWEPPMVDPAMYEALPMLTACFERVFVHNTIGDGYSLDGVDQSKLVKLYFPQPYKEVIQHLWEREKRLNRVVVINGNHKPKNRMGELYSTRMEAMVELAKQGVVDLYGGGWDKWCSRSSLWMPYWRNRKALNVIYRGRCESKHEMLSRYRFCLCFENMNMTGLVTEKIFDCLYAGTIPLYLGAPDIEKMIPKEAYIDCRNYKSWTEMWAEVSYMSDEQINEIRMAGKAFLESEVFLKYYNALTDQLISSLEPASE